MSAVVTNYRHEPPYLAWSDIFDNSLVLGKLYVILYIVYYIELNWTAIYFYFGTLWT